MMASGSIEIKNARIHNLKAIDVHIPQNKLTVITGVSGSVKSSLAFDTLYEEGKRRYLMFSGTQFMVDAVPAFDSITGLSPTVAVEQRVIRQSNPRSTVGTKVKISAMLAALFAGYGERSPEYDDGQPLDIAFFQKNSARRMCVKCLGKGVVKQIDVDKLFADREQHIYEIACGLGRRSSTRKMLEEFCQRHGMDLWEDKLSDLTEEQMELLKYGDGGKSKFYGFIPWITMLTNGSVTTSGRLASLLRDAGMMGDRRCAKCGGPGYVPEVMEVTVGGKNIRDILDMSVDEAKEYFAGRDDAICNMLTILQRVGMGYIKLGQATPTISGGESQRIKLAKELSKGRNNKGALYILDEPTTGLSFSDSGRLISLLNELVDMGSSIIVTEHDPYVLSNCDISLRWEREGATPEEILSPQEPRRN